MARVGHGSKMFFDDDQQFPDTQYVTFEYPGAGKTGKAKLLVYEHRIWSPHVQEEHENGNAFYGTEGYMTISKMGVWKLYGPKNELLKQEDGWYSVPEHTADLLDAMGTGKKPNADIEIGHHAEANALVRRTTATRSHCGARSATWTSIGRPGGPWSSTGRGSCPSRSGHSPLDA